MRKTELVLFDDIRHTVLKAIAYRLSYFVTSMVSGHLTTS